MFRLTLSGNILSASQREKETEVQGGEESCLRHPAVSVSWGSVGPGGSLEGREAVVGMSGRDCSKARLGGTLSPTSAPAGWQSLGSTEGCTLDSGACSPVAGPLWVAL